MFHENEENNNYEDLTKTTHQASYTHTKIYLKQRVRRSVRRGEIAGKTVSKEMKKVKFGQKGE